MASQTFNGNERSTTIARVGDDMVVTYHQTAVVRFNRDRVVLSSGGFRTATTKHRMNQAARTFNLGYTVFQRDYDWFVDFNGETLEFDDGMNLPLA